MSEYPGQSDLRDPLKVARKWGSSKTGVQHWWVQRVTALALIPLTLWFVYFALALVHVDYATAMSAIADPVHMFLLIVLTICTYWHGMLGLDVIIGDYVHTRWLEVTLQIALRFGAVAGAVATILAIMSVGLAAR